MPTVEGLRGQLTYNSRIAAALLEVLAESGDVAARARALRAMGSESAMLRGSPSWISTAHLGDMLRAVRIDGRLARRVGQVLVRRDGVGLALCYSGLATPEKAYRRSQHLLAREAEGARYEPCEIDAQRGRILFHPPPKGDAARLDPDTGAVICGVRAGMLETVPMLFGLVPARVRETKCAYRGDRACEFRVGWTRTPRSGLLLGLAAGAVVAGALVAASPHVPLPLWARALAGLGTALLVGAAGRAVDLARQLEAVAGARRGQLALLDQLDSGLAERMDELAKLGAGSDVPSGAGWSGEERRIRGLVPVSGEGARRAVDAAGGVGAAGEAGCAPIREAAAGLREELSALHALLENGAGAASRDDVRARVRSCATRARNVEAAAGLLERQLGAPDERDEAHDPRVLLEGAVDRVQPELPPEVRIELDVAPELVQGRVTVRCDAFQIAHVIEQLLRGAAEAVGESGTVRASLRALPTGVELAVVDQGGGLPDDAADQAFDPFLESGSAGAEGGLGFATCCRIVEEHGGRLQVQSRVGEGTRVSFLLPAVGGPHEPAEAG